MTTGIVGVALVRVDCYGILWNGVVLHSATPGDYGNQVRRLAPDHKVMAIYFPECHYRLHWN